MSTFENSFWTDGLLKDNAGPGASSMRSSASAGGSRSKLYRFLDGNVFGRSRRYHSDSEYGSGSDSDASSEGGQGGQGGQGARHASAASGGRQPTTTSVGKSLPVLASGSGSNASVFKARRSHFDEASASESEESEAEAIFPVRAKKSLRELLGGAKKPPQPQPSETSDSEPENTNIFRNIIQGKPALPQTPTTDTATSATAKLDLALLSPSTSNLSISSSRSNSESSLSEKYGQTKSELGRGATAVVRLCTSLTGDNKKYAVKQFKSRRKDEDQKSYIKKLTSEFNISSSLIHENVVRTVDLIQDDRKKWCVVMEYSEGGDLFSKIQSGLLVDSDLVDCFFKQLVRGVAYLHSEGVAHRDLKPENLLLDASCRILKITDFGVSTVFHLPLETVSNKSIGECGSGPYMAPEVFLGKPYEAAFVDVWAIGIIYYVMSYISIPWMSSRISDARYARYFESFGAFAPIERFLPLKRQLMYRMLNPDVSKRFDIKKVLDSEWVQSISACRVGAPVESPSHSHHKLLQR
ncbi:kinase-like domain-containing protein [Obelidium mucronatum]|nr:kinase-like domain-containing protein [Obelidium mucronatum]